MQRILLLLLAGAAVLTLAVRPPVQSAQAGYEDQIEDALRRLRASAADARAWRDLNEGVRAALNADDIETAANTAATAEELLRQLVTALGATRETPPPVDPQLARATTEASEAIASALEALRDGARDAAKASLARAQEAALHGSEQAIVLVVAAQSTGTGGEALVPPTLQLGGLLAATGGSAQVVDEVFADVRELVATQTLATALGRAGCGGSGPAIVRQLALGLGVDEARIVAAQGNVCRFTGEGTVQAQFRFSGGGGDNPFSGTWNLTGPLSLTFDVNGGVVQGSGTATITLDYRVNASGFQCNASGSGSVPLQVTGELAGETLHLRLLPSGEVPGTFTCTFGAGSMAQPINQSFPISLFPTVGTIDLLARDGAQGQLVEHPDVGAASNLFQDWAVTWTLRITQAR